MRGKEGGREEGGMEGRNKEYIIVSLHCRWHEVNSQSITTPLSTPLGVRKVTGVC